MAGWEFAFVVRTDLELHNHNLANTVEVPNSLLVVEVVGGFPNLEGEAIPVVSSYFQLEISRIEL